MLCINEYDCEVILDVVLVISRLLMDHHVCLWSINLA